MAWGRNERERDREPGTHTQVTGEVEGGVGRRRERQKKRETHTYDGGGKNQDKNHPPETMMMKKRLTICRKIIVIPVCNTRR